MRLAYKLIMKLKRLLIYLNYRRRFKKFGLHTILYKPLRLDGAKNIILEHHVQIRKLVWLGALPLCNQCNLIIRRGTIVGDLCHIYATHSILIEENVLIANNVYISDNIHNYEDINMPIMFQGVTQKRDVVIGNGSWIGEHVCIIGASIGRHCVIGANSVVTRDIPDYSVAVGSPAVIIKKYDFNLNKWIKV